MKKSKNKPVEIQQLTDADTFPSDEVIESALGEAYPAFEKFIEAIYSENLGLSHEWRYYKDGKAWLCKVTKKKKTAAWVSVWDGFFKIAFYFTEKTGKGIADLKIAQAIKKNYQSHKPIGNLKPVVINVKRQSQLKDVITLVEYKMSIR